MAKDANRPFTLEEIQLGGNSNREAHNGANIEIMKLRNNEIEFFFCEISKELKYRIYDVPFTAGKDSFRIVRARVLEREWVQNLVV